MLKIKDVDTVLTLKCKLSFGVLQSSVIGNSKKEKVIAFSYVYFPPSSITTCKFNYFVLNCGVTLLSEKN